VRFDPERHHRRSIRRKGHDYRQGVYFVTITAAARQPLFGEVRNGVVWLSAAGALIADVWMHLPIHFPSVRLDAFVVMPDHFHGILVLGEVDWWESITGASRTPFVLTPPMRYPPFWEQMLAAEARARGVPECLLQAPTAIVAPPVGARSPRPEILNPEISNPEISNPEISNPEILNPEISNPEILNPEILNPEISNHEILNPEILNPEISNHEILNPETPNHETPNHENSPGNPLGSMHDAVGFTHGAVGFTHGAVGFTQGAATAPLPNAPVRARSPHPEIPSHEASRHEDSLENPLGFTHGAVGFTHGAVGFTQGAATAPLPHETRSRLQNPTLGQIIAYFKYQTTKRYNLPQAQPGATLWHTNYYERRLATCDALSAARAYILTNPARAG
jgi:hypothetical protein